VSGRTGYVQTYQALGTLWTHPGRAHTAPNAKCTGNVNSDAARHGTVHSDAVCQGAVCPDAALHSICLLDGTCQDIFLLDGAVSGHFPSGRSRVRGFSFWAQPCQGKWRPDDVCHGTMVALSVNARNYSCRIRKHAAGSRHSGSVQFYSFYLMYIYICYYHTSRGNKGKLANTTQRVEHDAMSTMR